MILVALGSNIDGPWGTPEQSLRHALTLLNVSPLQLLRASTLIETEPFGKTDQPRFVNAVAEIATSLPPMELMQALHKIEQQGGRHRDQHWGPRTIDLDLIDYSGVIMDGPLTLPHPGIAARSFVLEPIAEIAPHWRHPVSNVTAQDMLAALTPV